MTSSWGRYLRPPRGSQNAVVVDDRDLRAATMRVDADPARRVTRGRSSSRISGRAAVIRAVSKRAVRAEGRSPATQVYAPVGTITASGCLSPTDARPRQRRRAGAGRGLADVRSELRGTTPAAPESAAPAPPGSSAPPRSGSSLGDRPGRRRSALVAGLGATSARTTVSMAPAAQRSRSRRRRGAAPIRVRCAGVVDRVGCSRAPERLRGWLRARHYLA